MHVRSLIPIAGAALLAAACAGSQAGTGTVSQHNVLTAEEIARVGDVDLHDALRRLRPTFLRSRATPSPTIPQQPVTVYLDGMQMLEGLDHLREIAAKNVKEVRFLEPQQANARFGSRNDGGALLITMK